MDSPLQKVLSVREVRMKVIMSTGTALFLQNQDTVLLNELKNYNSDIYWLTFNTIELLAEIQEQNFYHALFCLIFMMLNSESNGNTRYIFSENFVKDLAGLGLDNKQVLEYKNVIEKNVNNLPQELFTIISSINSKIEDEAIKPFVMTKDDSLYFYVHRTITTEKLFAKKYLNRINNNTPKNNSVEYEINDLLSEFENDNGLNLHHKQKTAIIKSISNNTLIVHGGPGTGKTTIALGIILANIKTKFLNENNLSHEAAIAAPTGRAANRIYETINNKLGENPPEARTIHRLLGYSPITKDFRFHENNKLKYKLVIIDECSMIDLFLFTKLISALDTDTKLVLLGDSNQLPSVELGKVFNDIADFKKSCSIELTESHRQKGEGKPILDLADKINSGNTDCNIQELNFNEKLITGGVGFIQAGQRDKRFENFTADWRENYYQNEKIKTLLKQKIFSTDKIIGSDFRKSIEELFTLYSNNKILTVTNYDTKEINNYFMQKENKKYVYHGAPVIINKNKYNVLTGIDLFNGDQGIALNINNGSTKDLKFVFYIRGEYVCISEKSFSPADYSLAYAITVHKSQGSEYNHVALVLPEQDKNEFMKREILYTGITRAKKSVIIFGNKSAFDKAINQSSTDKRNTGLGEILKIYV